MTRIQAVSSSSAGNADTLDGQHGSYYGILSEDRSGWIPLGACTYEASDDPTYTFSFASDMTSTLGVGMRIKLTDSGTQFFIITAVGAYSGGKTIITGYGGTDYNLSGGAITNPYYSLQKAPFGFPLDPTKWTVEVTDVTNRSQATPTNGTYYNLGSVSINIPLGLWDVSYNVCYGVRETSASFFDCIVTLSTANNSASDTDFNSYMGLETGANNQALNLTTGYKNKILNLAAKATYYLNTMTGVLATTIWNYNDIHKLFIRAVCVYL